MNKKKYDALCKYTPTKERLSASDLKDTSNRTLLFGYTCDRETWHVYIKDAMIYTVCYYAAAPTLEINVTTDHGYVPDKRLYPARCDYEFCCLLRERGVTLPFTTFDAREIKQLNDNGYYGKTL